MLYWSEMLVRRCTCSHSAQPGNLRRNFSRFAKLVTNCWTLHPVVANHAVFLKFHEAGLLRVRWIWMPATSPYPFCNRRVWQPLEFLGPHHLGPASRRSLAAD